MSKWTKEEEVELIKDVANGLQFEHIGIKRNRSNSAVELRLKKIVYENIIAGRSFEKMSKMLNLPVDKLRQYFYSYKDFKEKHTTHVDDITNLKANYSDIFGEKRISHSVNPVREIKEHKEHKECKEHKKIPDYTGNSCVFSKIQNDIDELRESHHHVLKRSEESVHNHHGGSKIDNLENKIKQLELENKLINLVVENKNLNSQLNKLIKEGKVDKNIKVAIKNIRSKRY